MAFSQKKIDSISRRIKIRIKSHLSHVEWNRWTVYATSLFRLKPNKQSNRFNGIVELFCLKRTQKVEIYRMNSRTHFGQAVENQFCASNDVYHVFHHITPWQPSCTSVLFLVQWMCFHTQQQMRKKPTTTTAHENSIIIRKQNTILVVAVSRFHSRITCGDTNRLCFSLSPYHIMIYWISTRIDYHMTDS